MPTKNPPKKTLYHSELVQRQEYVQVLIKSDVMASKFAGKPPYVIVELDGVERNYSCENDHIADLLRDLKGQTVVILAEGREDDAMITFDESGTVQATPAAPPPQKKTPPPAKTPPQRSQPPARQTTAPATQNVANSRLATNPPPPAHQPQNGNTQETPADRFKRVKTYLNRSANTYLAVLEAALYIQAQHKAVHGMDLTPEHFQALTASLFIAADRALMLGVMPTGEFGKLAGGEQQ